MAATHGRRKREKPLVSTTYAEKQLGNTKTITNLNAETVEFVLAFEARFLTVRVLVLKILTISGPHTSYEILARCEKFGRRVSIKTVENAIRTLRALNLVDKVNGGYVIRGWQ